MVSLKEINAFANAVGEHFRPRRIVLFGSYAYGHPMPDSDVDLLVIMPHPGHPAEQAAQIRKRVRSGFPLDLVVRSPGEIKRRLAMGDDFIREIIDQGKSLYEGSHEGMDSKGRG